MGLFDLIRRFFQGMQSSYAFSLLGKAFLRLRTAVMNPFRRVIRRAQQLVNVNMISAKLVAPINDKIRKILSGEAKSPEDYFTVGRFWISKALVYILILASCAAVFIYFNWIAAPLATTIETESRVTSIYYDYDDMDLGEFTGKANIRGANGKVVYTGDIAAGVCSGYGKLWNQDGALVYEGEFQNNRYEGNGTQYYPSGKPYYEGEFKENVFSGEGILYYADGSVQYEGAFENGAFCGEGILYNEKGTIIYSGNFFNGAYHGAGIGFYSNGIKKYEGEYYMGRMQGEGTYYSSAGREIYMGKFARDYIQYESLLGCTMKDAMEMFRENPIIYFSDGETCFLFSQAQIILKTDCLIEMKMEAQSTADGNGWFLPDTDGETLTETESSWEDEEDEASEDISEEEEEMKDLPVNNVYRVYYYLATDEWQTEEEADLGAITITEVSAYHSNADVGFLEGTYMVPESGAPSLNECVAIERIRLKNPTAFSTITYELTTKNKTHIAVGGINQAEGIYEEIYDVENIRYHLCYQMDQPNDLMFLTVENY